MNPNNILMLDKDGSPNQVAPENFQKAISSGLEPAFQMKDSNGDPHFVRKSNYDAAKNSGLKMSAEFDAINKDRGENADIGQGESAARGLANLATNGGADEVAGATSSFGALKGGAKTLANKFGANFNDAQDTSDINKYKLARDMYRQRDDESYEQNPWSYRAGGAVALAPTLLSNPLSSIKQAAAIGSGEGMLAGLGGGTDYTNKEQSGKDLLTQGAIGGVAGGAIGAGAQYIPQALEKFGVNRVAKFFGSNDAAGQRIMKRMPGGEEGFARNTLENKIVTPFKSTKGILNAADKAEEEAGNRIGNITEKLDSIGKPTNTQEELYNKVSGPRILARIQDEVMKPLTEASGDKGLARRVDSSYLRDLVDTVEKNPNMSFGQIKKEITSLGNVAYTPNGIDKPVNEVMQDIRRIMRDEQIKTAKHMLETKSADPQIVQDLLQANKDYSIATTAKKLAGKQADKLSRNNEISLRGIGVGAAMGSHGNPGIAAGMAGTELLRRYGNQLGGAGSYRISQFLKRHPQILNSLIQQGGKVAPKTDDDSQ